ncbi:MAG: hypothetical protein ABIC40_01590 [bacterium]
MNRIFIIAIAVLLLSFSLPTLASNFTIGDFDTADPEQAEDYSNAVSDLISDLEIIVIDENDNELFSIVPFPIELVALTAQAEIHLDNVTDETKLAEIIDTANINKPGPNSFAFVVEGSKEWVSKDVKLYRTENAEDGTTTRIEIPVMRVSDPTENEDGTSACVWMFAATDTDELAAFHISPGLIMVVGDDTDSVEFDCGFWRAWNLFDIE